ncbi:hypothetical protein pdam_00010406 [Pocillopora damicornis]|uniref:Uncharacterized protein n=1 Tax=Pocillopora damicornis TaxID=46731 RepID=A0A3M6URX9_POCDA|nr:hypothetical protein pdam_00010406 [Pocillopora damicornis]
MPLNDELPLSKGVSSRLRSVVGDVAVSWTLKSKYPPCGRSQNSRLGDCPIDNGNSSDIVVRLVVEWLRDENSRNDDAPRSGDFSWTKEVLSGLEDILPSEYVAPLTSGGGVSLDRPPLTGLGVDVSVDSSRMRNHSCLRKEHPRRCVNLSQGYHDPEVVSCESLSSMSGTWQGLKSNSSKLVKEISRKSKWFGMIPTGLLVSAMILPHTSYSEMKEDQRRLELSTQTRKPTKIFGRFAPQN